MLTQTYTEPFEELVRVLVFNVGLGVLGGVAYVEMLLDARAAKAIVVRNGLCIVRQLGVEKQWLQEQQARRLLPLSNGHGSRNPADLMTTYLGESDIQKYVQMADLYFASGRAAAARLHHNMRRKTNGYGWSQRARTHVWRRCHSRWRDSLFTLLKAPGGPRDTSFLAPFRITKGVKLDGSKFVIEDNWKQPEHAHRVLPFDWRGHTNLFDVDCGLENVDCDVRSVADFVVLEWWARVRCLH